MKDVFISYTTPDKTVAFDVVKFLESNGLKCFIAPRDVDPGKPFAANIMHAIDECAVNVLIASDHTNNSEHVLNEVDVMVAKKKALIPFFIEEFDLNDDFRYYLGRTHRIVAYPDAPELYFEKLKEAVFQLIPEKRIEINKPVEIKKESSVSSNTSTVFEYIPDRGIMINPEDRQRNVSFRTDTFISMFSEIYDKVCDIADEENAREIFNHAGRTCGINFAQRLRSQWDLEQRSPADYQEMLKKWCKFDSDVGWGKFDIELNVNEETEEVSGVLSINECFIVDKKDKKHVCEFVRGYCTGVIETLLCVDVKLNCITCPMKSMFKSKCEFEIVIA